jgi:hypothetical protein
MELIVKIELFHRLGNTYGRLKSKSDNIFSKKLKKLESQFPDAFLINEEFACNDEMHLMPRDLARLDSEFIGVRLGYVG